MMQNPNYFIYLWKINVCNFISCKGFKFYFKLSSLIHWKWLSFNVYMLCNKEFGLLERFFCVNLLIEFLFALICCVRACVFFHFQINLCLFLYRYYTTLKCANNIIGINLKLWPYCDMYYFLLLNLVIGVFVRILWQAKIFLI
jgi:hypothetical protein